MKLTTKSLGPAHTNRSAVAQFNRDIAERNYADAADDIALAVAELRAHGDIKRACVAAGIELSRLGTWRNKHPDLDVNVRKAIAFAKSPELSYAKWEAGR